MLRCRPGGFIHVSNMKVVLDSRHHCLQHGAFMSALYHWSQAAFQSEGRFRARLTVRFPYHHHRLLLTLGPAEGRRAAHTVGTAATFLIRWAVAVLFRLHRRNLARWREVHQVETETERTGKRRRNVRRRKSNSWSWGVHWSANSEYSIVHEKVDGRRRAAHSVHIQPPGPTTGLSGGKVQLRLRGSKLLRRTLGCTYQSGHHQFAEYCITTVAQKTTSCVAGFTGNRVPGGTCSGAFVQ